jgi:hypothetical protein
MELKNIQQLIDEKAENRLNKDLDDMRTTILSIGVLTATTESAFPDLEYGGKKTKPYWFFNLNGEFRRALYNYWLPIYKTREAENFLKRVEDLESEVDNLMNAQQYD